MQRPDLVPPGTRTLDIVDGGAHLLGEHLDPPIKAVFIYSHPEDAKARGLSNGVRVWNDLGEVHLPLLVTDVIPRGVVGTLKGAWLRTSDNGQTISALCPAHHADIAEGACFNDARVEVAAV